MNLANLHGLCRLLHRVLDGRHDVGAQLGFFDVKLGKNARFSINFRAPFFGGLNVQPAVASSLHSAGTDTDTHLFMQRTKVDRRAVLL